MNSNSDKQKWNIKSQITVFIIIGIIILFSTALVVYIQSQAIKYKPSLKQVVEEIPVEYYPIREFVNGCIKQVGEDAIQKLSAGGYIDMKDRELSGTMFSISLQAFESDALVFAPGSKFMIPYWWYLKTKSNCKDNCAFGTKKPYLYKREGSPSIEAQLEIYMKRNIDVCLENFTIFRQQGFIFQRVRDPKITVGITDSGVDFLVEYPFKITKGDVVQTISKFFNSVEVKLKRIYEAAFEVLNTEIRDQFLEKHAMNLIAVFEGMDAARFPPIGGYSMDCGAASLIWSKSDVKENMLIPMLMSYIPLLQFDGSSNYQPYNFNDPIRNSIYNYGMFIFTDPSKLNGLEVKANYLGWEPYVDINPSRGDVITPFGMCLVRDFNLAFVEAKFRYDLSFPVLFEIRDPTAFNNRGYSFYFAAESNVKSNFPVNTTDIYKFAPAALPPISPEPLFCDALQRLSGDIKITLKDAYTGKAIENALVTFCIPDADGTCNDEVCPLGSTKESGGKTMFSAKMPLGAGLLSFTKEGYHPYGMVYATNYNISDSFEIELYPYKEIKVEVKKKELKTKKSTKKDECKEEIDYYPWQFPFPSTELSDDIHSLGGINYDAELETLDLESDERAIVSVERLNPSLEPYSSFAEVTIGSDNMMELIPGNYTLTVDVLKDKKLTIPNETMCYCEGILGCGIKDTFTDSRKYVNMTETDIEPTVALGGVVVNFTVSKRDMMRGDKLLIYAITADYDSFKTHDNLGIMGAKEDLSNAYSDKLNPRFQ